ncbi:MAG TPA: dienelactone hydrolase family protein [Usitatibacter sp.]|jgi:carboxymethylenebutenolidase|nr:dienelactone hydrolase family protein [Usitatibacter sp.]
MERRKAGDFPPEVLKLFDGFVHGRMSRREFLDGAARYAVGGFTAVAMLEALSPNFAWAQQVDPADARIVTESVTYPSPKGSRTMRGYLARPVHATGKLPAIVVIHENRGLSPYIEDVARRLAVEGYLAFAPDALAPVGGYPGDEDKAREMFAKLDPAKRTEDLLAAVDYVKQRPDFNGKVGAVGFCFGGDIVNTIATRYPDLAAAVPYYGMQPPAAEAAKIKSPILAHYAGEDSRVTSGWPAFEKVLAEHHVEHQAYIYPHAQHGFHNDTTPRYDEAAAKLSWERTLAFFQQHLKA